MTRTSSRPSAVDQRSITVGAELAGQDPDRRGAARPQGDGGSRVRGPQAGVRGRVRRQRARNRCWQSTAAKKPRRGPVGVRRRAGELELERAGHADAVLVHREALVGVGVAGTAGRPSGSTRRRRGPSAGRAPPGTRPASPRPRRRPRPPRPWCARASPASGLNREIPSGTTATDVSSGYSVEDAGERVVERLAVVDPGAHDDLAAHLDAVVEERAQPAQARRASRVAQHPRAQLGIGGVDADVQRRQPLGDDPLEVGLGEPGQRREVPVQEAQPVVVVLQVQAPAQALRAAGR